MDIDLETSGALYEKLLQLESEVRKKLKEKHSRPAWWPGSPWCIYSGMDIMDIIPAGHQGAVHNTKKTVTLQTL